MFTNVRLGEGRPLALDGLYFGRRLPPIFGRLLLDGLLNCFPNENNVYDEWRERLSGTF